MKLTIYEQGGGVVALNDVSAPTLMRAIRDAGLNITAQCGGCASCGTCHVYVDEAWLTKLKPADDFESAMLDIVEERRDSSRLSCQIELTQDLNGLTVTLAPGAGFA